MLMDKINREKDQLASPGNRIVEATGAVLVAWRRIQVYRSSFDSMEEDTGIYRSSIGSMEEDTGIQEQYW